MISTVGKGGVETGGCDLLLEGAQKVHQFFTK